MWGQDFCSSMKPRSPEKYTKHSGHSKILLNKSACSTSSITDIHAVKREWPSSPTLAELQQMVYFPNSIYFFVLFSMQLTFAYVRMILLETGIGTKGSLVCFVYLLVSTVFQKFLCTFKSTSVFRHGSEEAIVNTNK